MSLSYRLDYSLSYFRVDLAKSRTGTYNYPPTSRTLRHSVMVATAALLPHMLHLMYECKNDIHISKLSICLMTHLASMWPSSLASTMSAPSPV